jgi:hypothetical protein
MARQQPWVSTLRASLKQEHGFGWGIREKQGKVQLTRRFEDGSRSSVTLSVSWDSRCLSEVMGLVNEIRQRMEAHQMGLGEAYKLIHSPDRKTRKQLNWPEAVERFHQHKVKVSGQTTDETFRRMYRPALGEMLEIMEGKPRPTSGQELLAAICRRDGNKPGTRWRRIKLQNTAQFLKFAVKDLGAPDRWLPPTDLSSMIGERDASTAPEASIPLKDEQVVRVLGDIKDQRWRDAVALIACFGLRPVELLHCRPQGKYLYVSYRKRTARGMTEPGEVIGLDPEGMEGESARLLEAMKSGAFQLPPLRSIQSEVAESLSQHLGRKPSWRLLKEEVRAKGGKLTPYSFRHGYALRAHERYRYSVRVTAKLMRHSVETHCRHYGSWVDREILESAYEASVAKTSRSISQGYD